MSKPVAVLFPHVFRGTDGTRIAAEWGRLIVPENRRKPNARSIELAFLRIAARKPKRRPPIVYLAGGPGSSGILHGESRASRFVAWAEDADVILLDQRGVGQSRPCLETSLFFDLPLDRPVDRADIVGAARNLATEAARYWSERGVDLAGYTTEESADDIDALRRSLGYERIIPVGYSYGSHLCLSVIRRHGRFVERAVVGGSEGPDHTYKLPSNVDSALAELDRRIAGDSRYVGKWDGFLAALREILARLEQKSATARVKDPHGVERSIAVGPWDLRVAVAETLGSSARLAALPANVLATLNGDHAWLGRAAMIERRKPFGSAMSYMMDAASGASPARLQRIVQEAQRSPLADAINLPFPDVAAALPPVDLGPAFRADVESEVPTLFFCGTLDGRTPPGNAAEIAKGFAKAHVLSVENGSHDTTWWPGPNAEIERVMSTFLAGKPVGETALTLPFAFDPPRS
jgi:pimeloyl-ACP methyl ester carboxylesterase